MAEIVTETPQVQESPRKPGLKPRMALLLLLAFTFLVYHPVRSFQFINCDDPAYITEQPLVQKGLTWEGIKWSVTSLESGFYQPLVWISHMTDCHLFGLQPGGHHVMNVLIHAINVLLLYVILIRVTSRPWTVLFVTALFALHPINVESVAWVAERKNVLSTTLWFLTTWGYLHYVSSPSFWRYSLVIVLFILGLTAKSMLVTLPCTLILLDYWPLRRLNEDEGLWSKKARNLYLEKVPLLLISLVFSYLTVKAEKNLGALNFDAQVSMAQKISNVVISYFAYLQKTILPIHFSIYYPFPTEPIPGFKVGGVALLLGLVSYAVIRFRTRAPFLLVGWLWYLGTFVPVIGFILPGAYAMADRYAYVPLIGIFVAIAWACSLKPVSRFFPAGVRSALALIFILVLGVVTRKNVEHWRNDISVYTHAIEVTRDNTFAHSNLGQAYLDAGKLDDAMHHFEQVMRIDPQDYTGFNGYGAALFRKGFKRESEDYFRNAVALDFESGKSHYHLALVLFEMNEVKEAREHALKSTELMSTQPQPFLLLGRISCREGKWDEAVAYYQKALSFQKNVFEIHDSMGTAFLNSGNFPAAVEAFSKACDLIPQSAPARNNLGIALLNLGRFQEAEECFRKAIDNDAEYGIGHFNLANVMRETGRLQEAVQHFTMATRLMPEHLPSHEQLGILYLQAGDLVRAEASFRQVIQLQPGSIPGHVGLEIIYRNQGRLAEAEQIRENLASAGSEADAVREQFAKIMSNRNNPSSD